MRIVWRVLFLLGLLISLFGIAVDFILPGASPGLNLPQILIIAAGLLIALGAFLSRRVQRVSFSRGGARSALFKVMLPSRC